MVSIKKYNLLNFDIFQNLVLILLEINLIKFDYIYNFLKIN